MKRILVVEDNALNREITRELLEQVEIVVEEAEDGDIAVDKVRWSEKGYYDLILEANEDEYDVLLVEVCDMTLDFCKYCFDFDMIGILTSPVKLL